MGSNTVTQYQWTVGFFKYQNFFPAPNYKICSTRHYHTNTFLDFVFLFRNNAILFVLLQLKSSNEEVGNIINRLFLCCCRQDVISNLFMQSFNMLQSKIQ